MTTASLQFAFYGDDFTGSTDAMEVLEWGGVRTMLFLEPPTPEFLRENFPEVQAVGLAGVSRSMTPAEMDDTLHEAFKALAGLGAPALHYKVCSTFDSSPTIGSIGHAIDVGIKTFGPQIVPVIAGAPFLRRYVAFGNLFAGMNAGIYRIDRHPTMSRHPVTPMTEGDLALHLGQQTSRPIGKIDVLQLAAPVEEIYKTLSTLYERDIEIVVFDTVEDDHLKMLGGVIDRLISAGPANPPQFVVGSSGVERAMILHWQSCGAVSEPISVPTLDGVDQVIVMSGSASPVTAAQIDWAGVNGYALLRLNAVRLLDTASVDDERELIVAAALDKLAQGKSVVLYTALGPDDPAIATTNARLAQLGIERHMTSRILGKQQGLILRELIEHTGIRRVVSAGGDTSSFAARQLGIYALSAAAPIAPGSPLCRAYSSLPSFDGLLIAMKGGQVGQTDYFERVRRGRQ